MSSCTLNPVSPLQSRNTIEVNGIHYEISVDREITSAQRQHITTLATRVINEIPLRQYTCFSVWNNRIMMYPDEVRELHFFVGTSSLDPDLRITIQRNSNESEKIEVTNSTEGVAPSSTSTSVDNGSTVTGSLSASNTQALLRAADDAIRDAERARSSFDEIFSGE